VLEIILEPLRQVMHDGVNLLCPDGARRHCFPVMSQYICDYEEQVVLAGILCGHCPQCTIPAFRFPRSTDGELAPNERELEHEREQ
jgi:Plavaka transposase